MSADNDNKREVIKWVLLLGAATMLSVFDRLTVEDTKTFLILLAGYLTGRIQNGREGKE